MWNADAMSCFCPGPSQGLCLGQPQGSMSLGFSLRAVGGWAGGGASYWQAPLRTAVLCRCLWPSSVQCQGLEPDSSVTELLGLLGGREAGLGRYGLEGETRGARGSLALCPGPLASDSGLRWRWEQSRAVWGWQVVAWLWSSGAVPGQQVLLASTGIFTVP